jgi:hypothetical protein
MDKGNKIVLDIDKNFEGDVDELLKKNFESVCYLASRVSRSSYDIQGMVASYMFNYTSALSAAGLFENRTGGSCGFKDDDKDVIEYSCHDGDDETIFYAEYKLDVFQTHQVGVGSYEFNKALGAESSAQVPAPLDKRDTYKEGDLVILTELLGDGTKAREELFTVKESHYASLDGFVFLSIEKAGKWKLDPYKHVFFPNQTYLSKSRIESLKEDIYKCYDTAKEIGRRYQWD